MVDDSQYVHAPIAYFSTLYPFHFATVPACVLLPPARRRTLHGPLHQASFEESNPFPEINSQLAEFQSLPCSPRLSRSNNLLISIGKSMNRHGRLRLSQTIRSRHGILSERQVVG